MSVLKIAAENITCEPSVCRDAYLCRCFKISHETVERAVIERELSTVDEVTQATTAGGGCTCCHKKIEAVIAEATAKGDLKSVA